MVSMSSIKSTLQIIAYPCAPGCRDPRHPAPVAGPSPDASMVITGTAWVICWADSNSVANTTSAQEAGEVDAEATTEADSGRPGRDRSAAERRLGRAGDRAGAW